MTRLFNILSHTMVIGFFSVIFYILLSPPRFGNIYTIPASILCGCALYFLLKKFGR